MFDVLLHVSGLEPDAAEGEQEQAKEGDLATVPLYEAPCPVEVPLKPAPHPQRPRIPRRLAL